jgi:aminocarboxymuconate-semialdehyde decarboxylase
VKTIDVHAHILSRDTMERVARAAPQAGLKFTVTDHEFGVIEAGGAAYPAFPRGAWDLERRFADMAKSDVDVQVLSNTPQTFLYGIDGAANAAAAAVQNDAIAQHVKDDPDRFYGIATLPMQAPELAAAELKRAIGSLGLRGAQIGSNVNGRNLDEPELEPVWEAANALGAFIMVHPTQVAGADRLKKYYLGNLIGNPLDSTIAAASLVFGGVTARYPAIRFLFVHGGGFIPYQVGRFGHGWQVRGEPKVHLKEPPEASFRRLWLDTITHAPAPLAFLVSSWGASRVVLGSDYPYDMGTFECARQVKALPVGDDVKALILGAGPLQLLGAA